MTRARLPAAVCLGLSLSLLSACAGAGAGAPDPGSGVVGPGVVVEGRADNPLFAGGMQDPRVGRSSSGLSSAPPTRIRIPSIGVDSALEYLTIGEDGRLETPADYDLAGWYAGGVAPGSIGPAIIAGHVDSPTAPAVFAHLANLARGAEVVVTTADGSELTFHMTGSTQSPKSNFPTAEVYSNVPAAELRLITCAGGFDSSAGHYTDNLIVFATLAD